MILKGPEFNTNAMLIFSSFSCLLLCSVVPRFVISVRELYDHDPRRQRQGIDSGFGVSSQPTTSENAAMSAIVFAEVSPEEGQIVEGEVGESEAISRLEVVEDGAHQV